MGPEGYQSSAKHQRHSEHFHVYSTFSNKFSSIWSVGLSYVQDDALKMIFVEKK